MGLVFVWGYPVPRLRYEKFVEGDENVIITS